MMLPLPPDIDPGPFEPDDATTNRTTLAVVLSVFALGLAVCVWAFWGIVR